MDARNERAAEQAAEQAATFPLPRRRLRLHGAEKDAAGDKSSPTKLNTLHRRRRRFVDLPDAFINWF